MAATGWPVHERPAAAVIATMVRRLTDVLVGAVETDDLLLFVKTLAVLDEVVRPKPLVIGLDSDLLGHQDSNVVAATESALARYGLDAGVALVDDEPRRPWWARRKAGAR